MSWKERKRKLISKLPTLLDVLERISLKEEVWHLNKTPFRHLFPTHYQEGMYSSVVDSDGNTFLLPLEILPFTYYRGEAECHKPCKPSLYRKTMNPAKVFVERLKACEFELVINDHPLTKIFKNQTVINFPDGNQQLIHLNIDPLALAQHYGIYTELLDLTVNKWVAAFFACTRLNSMGIYEPIHDSDSYGMFYIYGMQDQSSDMVSSHGFYDRKLKPIGLQPFSRPGEQGGYVLRMTKEEDFNKLCKTKIKFRHDPIVSDLIFNYANRSKKLFPYEPIQDKAKIICSSHTFSEAACNLVKQKYYPSTPQLLIEAWMQNQHVTIHRGRLVTFTEIEKLTLLKEWPGMQAKFWSRVIPRYTVTPSGDFTTK